jgi:hypothetical protein
MAPHALRAMPRTAAPHAEHVGTVRRSSVTSSAWRGHGKETEMGWTRFQGHLLRTRPVHVLRDTLETARRMPKA